jgi:hypothetical protein
MSRSKLGFWAFAFWWDLVAIAASFAQAAPEGRDLKSRQKATLPRGFGLIEQVKSGTN